MQICFRICGGYFMEILKQNEENRRFGFENNWLD